MARESVDPPATGFFSRLGALTRPAPVPLTAAVVKSVSNEKISTRKDQRASGEAWKVWRQVGEIHYETTQQARLVGRLDWRVEINGTPMETEDAQETLTSAFGKNVRDLQVMAALHLQVAGGYYLVRTTPGDSTSWKIIPIDPDYKNKKLIDQADIVIEVTNPDPKDDKLLDSPVLAALDVANELILLRGQARAAARSRTAQLNTLLYPLEGAGKNREEFEQRMVEVMTAPLADERSTASVVPNIVGFQGDLIEKWRTLDITGPIDEKLHERIDRLVQQLAIVLDCPPELLLGTADLNHWTSWLVAEDNWLGHVEPLSAPIGRGMAEAITEAANLTESGQMLEIAPDPAPLLKRRPTITDALSANQAGLVNAEWTRQQLGADETDAPQVSEDDPALTLAFEMVSRAPALAANPGLDVLVSQIRAAMAGAEIPSVPDAESISDELPEIESGPASGPPVDATEPAAAAIMTATLMEQLKQPVIAAVPEPEVSAQRLAEIDLQAFEEAQDLVHDTADRAMEKLGARLRSIAQGRKIELPDVPNQDLAANYDEVIPNQEEIVDEVARANAPKLRRLIDRAYRLCRVAGVGVDPDETATESAINVFVPWINEQVNVMRQGKTGDAEAWALAHRVVSIAGGNLDPIPVVAATGASETVKGIALGLRVLEVLSADYDLITDEWEWYHAYDGPSPHPEHVQLDGRTIRPGGTILENGVNWYPGDHAGCQCLAMPVLVKRESVAAA